MSITKIERWDDDLAMRLPADVVEALCLREGDEVDVEVIGRGRFAIRTNNGRTVEFFNRSRI